MGEIDANEAYKATLAQLKSSKNLVGDKGVDYDPYRQHSS